MNTLDLAALDNAITSLRSVARDGLISTDIWDRATGLSLAGWNSNPASVALFNQVTDGLLNIQSDFPGINDWYALNLKDDTIFLLTISESVMQSAVLDEKKVGLGVAFSVVLPTMLTSVRSAVGAE